MANPADNCLIKVANVILEGRYGGPQARIAIVAESLKKYNVETIVVFPKKGSEIFHKNLIEKGIQSRLLSLHRLSRQKLHLIKFFCLFAPELFSLYRVFKKERVNVVHCNNASQIKGVIAGRLAGAKVVWHLQNTQAPNAIKIIFNYLLAPCFCDGFITAGERVQNYYLTGNNHLDKPIAIIQAPVETTSFDPEHVQECERIVTATGSKIVTIGNINPAKGFEYFLSMAAHLNKRCSNLSFFIVGPHLSTQKKYSRKIVNRANKLGLKNLQFYGFSENVASVLKAADIYVCSSIREASPISVWEAMAMAKPIVSTDVGDVAMLIKDGENGFVVPPKNAKLLAQKVSLLIGNEKLRRELGRKARETAIKYLDVDICAKKHADFYRSIMGE